MSRSVRLSRQAQRDADEITRYYATEAGLEISARFVDALATTLSILADYPHLGVPRPWLFSGRPGLRMRLVTGSFDRYEIFYEPRGSGIFVVRIMHGSRAI